MTFEGVIGFFMGKGIESVEILEDYELQFQALL